MNPKQIKFLKKRSKRLKNLRRNRIISRIPKAERKRLAELEITRLKIENEKTQGESEKRVRIYHRIGRGATLEKILEEGLKSREKLIEEGAPVEGYDLLEDQKKNIYFRYDPNIEKGDKEEKWVAIEVDPKKTFVYNQELRVKKMEKPWMRNKPLRGGLNEQIIKDPKRAAKEYQRLEREQKQRDYNNSKMTLEEFLEKKKKAEEIQKELPPGYRVIFHPLSAEPLVINGKDIHKYGPEWYYPHEIIKKDYIPPNQFVNHSGKKVRKNNKKI